MTKTAPSTQPWRKTPLIESSALSRAAGCKVFLKLDNLQPAGSFKSRGIGNYLLARLRERGDDPDIHFYSSSGGNAGLACVTAAQDLGHPATVVVPMSTKPMMIAKIRVAGATDVIQHGASWAEADRFLREEILTRDTKGVYVPPFDHPDIWKGNSTIVDEIAADFRDSHGAQDHARDAKTVQAEKPDAIICSVGGGGLFIGIMQGLERHGWSPDVSVVAVETAGADSLASALDANELVTLTGITSIATSLGATRVAEKAFELGQLGRENVQNNVKSLVLSDAEAAMGSWRLADDERLLVEAACGVSVAVCYNGKRLKQLLPHLTPESKVVLVVCGGSNITVEGLAEYRRVYGPLVDKLGAADDEMVPSSVTAPRG
ncbi:tryptophan synthase beta subunit-like PLP-dependent enzyme [Xylona heveae TC161]|uniref:L-serine ammonia-lyase n=1 Tax=Xylona heveae (strain CBS 132557 / TC161) TaxID=1328760 RepID=A0A165I9T1_XYLHT|nr:tryptophan synthase beta subunit-like PLP-dependent enzyme [Xylona heveae TC161]KZF24594.1 tryptophan synthase beta subunit-like PLP-dependent enzyme [Xylona heveae TC161]